MKCLACILVIVLAVACGSEGGPAAPEMEEVEGLSPWEDPAEVIFTPGQMTAGAEWAESEILAGLDEGTRIGMLVDLIIPSADFWKDRQVQVRGFSEDGKATEWMDAELTFAEEHYLVARADPGVHMLAAQLRLPSKHLWEVGSVSLASVVPASDEEPVEAALETDRSALSLPAGVIPRSEWNAKQTKCSSLNTNKYRMAIHHTFTSPSYGGSYAARIKAIQSYHMDVRGWCDVGYHYLITEDGSVWEGRPVKYRGAHVANNNTGNIGISFVGCFEPGECSSIGVMWPTQDALVAAGALIGELADEYGITIGSSAIKNHRDHSGASTTCPGDNIAEKVPTIFALAKEETQPEDLPEPEEDEVSEGRIMGVVWDLSVTDGPSDTGVVRLDQATVAVAGQSQPVKQSSAWWEFVVAPGQHTVTASAPGYQTGARTVVVVPGEQIWSSVGLTPDEDQPTPGPGDVTVRVRDASGNPIRDSLVHIPNVFWRVTNDAGELTVGMPAGPMTFTAYGVDYKARTMEVTVAGDTTVDAVLQPATKLWWTGKVQGVVWDLSVTDGPSDEGARRLDDAIIVCTCGLAVRAREEDAHWAFDVNPGEYIFVADAPGYQFASKQVSVAYKAEEWASIGLIPKD